MTEQDKETFVVLEDENELIEEAEPVINEQMPISGERAAVPTAAKVSDVEIPDSGKPNLLVYDMWEVNEKLRKGISPQQEREERADVLFISHRNGMLLWVVFSLCLLLILTTFFNILYALNKPAKGIPNTEQVGIYKKVERTQQEIEGFAERISLLMETWKFETISGHARRVTPYLDPTLRAKWESDFSKLTNDAITFKERALFEPVLVRYRGITDEIAHSIIIYYQVYRGRGEQEGAFRFDALVRRCKVLVIQEGSITDENSYGMYVTKVIDIPERTYMANERFAKERNPWDLGLGIQTKVKKENKVKAEQEK
jgi:hypothetical protein